MRESFKQVDTKAFELPETTFVRDIETRVFQSIVVQCLSHIAGVAIADGSLIDTLLGRDASERVSAVHVEQDQKNHSVSIKVEVNVAYGVPIPQKAEEIQSHVVKDISSFTGLHVSCVHVVFKNLISAKESLEETVGRLQKQESVVS